MCSEEHSVEWGITEGSSVGALQRTFWVHPAPTPLPRNWFNKPSEWEQPSSHQTSWPRLLGPSDWSGGGDQQWTNVPITGLTPQLCDWPEACWIVTQAGLEEAFWESSEHRVMLPEDIPLPGKWNHFCLEENIQFCAHTEKQKHEPLRESTWQLLMPSF